jgi:caa(3)-type oxidase subunit IV
MAETRVQEQPQTRPRRYIEIGVVLAVLIGIELALYYGRQFGLRRDVAIGGIITAAAFKAVLATTWFMDLKSDHAFYRQVFVGGVILALLVFAAAMLIMVFGAPAP